jgi:hypothetical protein
VLRVVLHLTQIGSVLTRSDASYSEATLLAVGLRGLQESPVTQGWCSDNAASCPDLIGMLGCEGQLQSELLVREQPITSEHAPDAGEVPFAAAVRDLCPFSCTSCPCVNEYDLQMQKSRADITGSICEQLIASGSHDCSVDFCPSCDFPGVCDVTCNYCDLPDAAMKNLCQDSYGVAPRVRPVFRR